MVSVPRRRKETTPPRRGSAESHPMGRAGNPSVSFWISLILDFGDCTLG